MSENTTSPKSSVIQPTSTIDVLAKVRADLAAASADDASRRVRCPDCQAMTRDIEKHKRIHGHELMTNSHEITVNYYNTDDGVWLDCSCGWALNMNFFPTIEELMVASDKHRK